MASEGLAILEQSGDEILSSQSSELTEPPLQHQKPDIFRLAEPPQGKAQHIAPVTC